MNPTVVPTVPTLSRPVGTLKTPANIGCPDRPDCPDRKTQAGGKNAIPLASLAGRIRARMAQDETEAEAMTAGLSALSPLDLPSPDPLTMGLLRGFHEHRVRLAGGHPSCPVSAAVAAEPSIHTAQTSGTPS